MDRENLVPLLGLLALAGAGAVMLYATSGPGVPPLEPAPAPAAPGSRANAPERGPRLVSRGEVGDRPEAPQGARNLVVVTGVAVRRDALEPYGGPEGLTPRLGELAAAGARFDDAIAAGVWTRESVAAMWTGLHAVDVGMVEPSPRPSRRRLDPSHTTLAEVLAQRGWWTIGVNASPEITRPGSALWQGTDHVRDSHPQGFKAQNRLTNAAAAQQALRMLADRPPDRPFYLQVVMTGSHKPIRVPPAEFRPWADAGLPNPAYMATVRRLDDAVGLLLGGLASQGVLDDTYVVFVADSGEGLNRPEHHGPAHGRYLARSAAQVPWIVRGPGIPAGRVVQGVASGVDFAPTVLGLLGVDGLGEVSGRDLSAALRGRAATTDRPFAIADTWYLNANRASIWTSAVQCQRDFGSVGLEGDGFVDGCFDRAADPDFTTPVDAPEWMARLVAWREAHRPAGGDP